MSRNVGVSVVTLIAVLLGVSLMLDTVSSARGDPEPGPCSFTRASDNTGACPLDEGWSECKFSNGSQGECTNLMRNYAKVETDFPSSCPTTTDRKNCNSPNAQCYEKVVCKWDAFGSPDKCIIDYFTGFVIPKPKRTTQNCPP